MRGRTQSPPGARVGAGWLRGRTHHWRLDISTRWFAESGVMYIEATRILAPNRDDLWGEVHKWESLAAKEPSRGNAAAAISALRMLGCRRYSQCAPIVLHALASEKVTWQSDNSVSAPVSLEGNPPPPPQPSQDLHVVAQLPTASTAAAAATFAVPASWLGSSDFRCRASAEHAGRSVGLAMACPFDTGDLETRLTQR